MQDNIKTQLTSVLKNEWDIELPGIISEEVILAKLAERVVRLMEHGAETFFQLMYRLDIPEHRLWQVLHGGASPQEIARLIYDRQLQKIQSRLQNRGEQSQDPDLNW